MKHWKDICLGENSTVLKAMETLTETGSRFLAIISSSNELLGTLTDGDIRRYLLKGGKVQGLISEAMNRDPIVGNVDTPNFKLLEIMKRNDFTHIPIIDEGRKLIHIISLREIQAPKEKRENAVVLMVGGLGARLGELTSNCPKPMLKIGEKPILEYIIEGLKEYGFHNFYFSVNYKSDVIESYFGDGSKFDINIQYIREKERMGTAGSLSLFVPPNDKPIIVMNGDVLTKVNFSALIDFHEQSTLDACICSIRHDYQIPFGVIHQENDHVSRIEEKPTFSYLVNAGIYSMNPSILSLLPLGVYYDMPTFIEHLITQGKSVKTFQIHDYWLDIGRHDDLNRAETEYKKIIR